MAGVLGSSSGRLHGLLGKLPRGLDRAEEGRKRFGHGGGQNRPVHVRRRVDSSAASAPA